ncbi:MAG: protein tyrosine phosphatase family protein [Gammaproteobacteria bacterium]|nr:protein tyrosine phosphatase family protein [Gammaproteobacteria bacterium]MDH3577247.1 protein tyrosine phosphatase family protein [Gammaproteobacteria bacterium]
MRKTYWLLACGGLALSACAGDIEATPASPLKVDLENVVADGVVRPVDGITSAGQPDEAAFGIFADSGYAAVIDLRTDGEDRGLDEKAVVEGLGMDYVSLPIGSDGISFENARALDELLKAYDKPVLVHCASANRVGALLALRASLGGADDETAMQLGRQGGMTRLEPKVREILTPEGP